MSHERRNSRFPLAALLALLAVAAQGVSIDTRWVNRAAPDYRVELRPNERTQPVLVGDILYYATLSGDVYAIHRTNGYQFWKKRLPGPVDGALSYGRAKLFIGTTTGHLYALNARDGSEAWHLQIGLPWLTPPLQVGARLYVTASNHELYVLQERNGREIWHYSRRGDEKMTIRAAGAPAVFGNEVYQGFADGHVVALTQDGKEAWSKRLRTRDRFYDVTMAPHVDDKRVIVATYDGNLYSLDRLSGSVQWSIPVGVYGGVLVDGDDVYFAGLDRHFYAVDARSGNVRWKTAFPRGVGMKPVLLGDRLVFTTSGDPICVVSARDGKILAEEAVGTGSMAPPAAHSDGWFYALSNYGNLYAFALTERTPRRSGLRVLSTPSAIQRDLVRERSHRSPS